MGGNVILIADTAHWNQIMDDSNGKLVFVDFFAEWCGPCRQVGPQFEKWSTDEKYNNVVFVKVDVDTCEEIAANCKISAMPTFQVWRKTGDKPEKVGEQVGAHLEKVLKLLEDAMAK